MEKVGWLRLCVVLTIDLFIWASELVIYVLYVVNPASTETTLPPALSATALGLLIVNALSAAVRFALWEYQFGSALAYFYPLQGTKRIDDFAWRYGVYEKTNFITALLLLLLRVVFTIHFALTIDDVLVFTPFTPLQVLLASISTIFLMLVLLLFMLGDQFYSGSLAYPTPKGQ
jgi:hypothetical protein